MRVLVASAQVPFMRGGAEAMTEGLVGALRCAGHSVEVVQLPFKFSPLSAVVENMEMWQVQDFSRFDVGEIDRVIALKFPAIHVQHHSKTVWLMHQHRSVYELFGTPYGEQSSDSNLEFRSRIIEADTRSLLAAEAVFTISNTVSERLKKFNGVGSQALYQPPPYAESYASGPVYPYIYCPSRLESLKRQDLLIRAMPYVSKPVMAIIAGEGGMESHYRKLAVDLGVEKRIKFVGRIDGIQMRRYYSNALAVFFGPLSEDYGFITLESMLSAKPVITCFDSGGPCEFVVNEETGYVVEPDPMEIADVISRLWGNRNMANSYGRNALDHYRRLGISWDRVVSKILRSE